MKIPRQNFAQQRSHIARPARFAIAAVTVLLTGAQAPLAGSAETRPAGVTAAPKLAQPAIGGMADQPMPVALENLIANFRKTRMACSTYSFPTGFVIHETKRGETAKTIIQRYWAGLPLKEDILKALISRLNPEVPVKGLSTPFKTGSLLAIPLASEMNAVLFDQPAKSVGEAEDDKRDQALNGNFASGWVKFP